MIRSTLKKIAKRLLRPLIQPATGQSTVHKHAPKGKSTASQVPPAPVVASDPTRFKTLIATLTELTESDTEIVEIEHTRNTLTLTLKGGAAASESSMAATRLALQRLILGEFSDLKTVKVNAA